MQSGCYACSIEPLDRMVDIACSVPGVAGAQIAGAGRGGGIMILAKKEVVDVVHKALAEQYYAPYGLEPAIINCVSVAGAGLVEF